MRSGDPSSNVDTCHDSEAPCPRLCLEISFLRWVRCGIQISCDTKEKVYGRLAPSVSVQGLLGRTHRNEFGGRFWKTSTQTCKRISVGIVIILKGLLFPLPYLLLLLFRLRCLGRVSLLNRLKIGLKGRRSSLPQDGSRVVKSLVAFRIMVLPIDASVLKNPVCFVWAYSTDLDRTSINICYEAIWWRMLTPML